VGFQVDATWLYNDRLSNVRTLNIMAAGIYAYTGWPLQRIMQTRRRLVDATLDDIRANKIRGDDTGGLASEPLDDNATVSLTGGGGMTFIIEVAPDDAEAK
jgi:hypothetical protein